MPPSYQKYLPQFVLNLNKLNYSWNPKGELMIDNQPIAMSHVADLFSYISRNRRDDKIPIGFNEFKTAIKKTNIPLEFIARKSLKAELYTTDESFNNANRITYVKKAFSDPEYFLENKYADSQSLKRSHSEEQMKWLNY